MTLPKGWRMVDLGDVCEHTLGKMLDQKKNKGVLRPYLRNPNVQWFDFDLRELREMPFEDREIHKFQLEAGDVVICEGGEAGRAAVWDSRMPGIQIQKALHRVRCGPELFNQFLVHRLFFDAKRGRLSEYFTGTTIPHFTGQDFHRYRIPRHADTLFAALQSAAFAGTLFAGADTSKGEVAKHVPPALRASRPLDAATM